MTITKRRSNEVVLVFCPPRAEVSKSPICFSTTRFVSSLDPGLFAKGEINTKKGSLESRLLLGPE